MEPYEFVNINTTGNQAKHAARFSEVINAYAEDGWRVVQIQRPSVIGPLDVLFEGEDED